MGFSPCGAIPSKFGFGSVSAAQPARRTLPLQHGISPSDRRYRCPAQRNLAESYSATPMLGSRPMTLVTIGCLIQRVQQLGVARLAAEETARALCDQPPQSPHRLVTLQNGLTAHNQCDVDCSLRSDFTARIPRHLESLQGMR